MAGQSAFRHLKGPVLVSACLLGIPCRYDGCSKTCPDIMTLSGIVPIPVCPEQLGGLPTPRMAASFASGDGRDVLKGRARLVRADGAEVTANFIAGAQQALSIARIIGIRQAVLKDGSPSCAACTVTIEGKKVPGMGVTAALLHEHGILIMNEHGRYEEGPGQGCGKP